jgi:hypothetical protein
MRNSTFQMLNAVDTASQTSASCDFTGGTATAFVSFPGIYTFGANTYPGIQNASSSSIFAKMDCYEQ